MHALLSFIRPPLSLLPLGPLGQFSWCARGGAYAAMDLMLAAAAHGFDTCPMEGFSGTGVARSLGLPRQCAVVLVVAIGHRAGREGGALLAPQPGGCHKGGLMEI